MRFANFWYGARRGIRRRPWRLMRLNRLFVPFAGCRGFPAAPVPADGQSVAFVFACCGQCGQPVVAAPAKVRRLAAVPARLVVR